MNQTSLLNADDVRPNTTDVDSSSVAGVISTVIPAVFVRYTWTEFASVHAPLSIQVDRYLTPIIYIIGLTGNLLALIVWMEKRMRQNNSSAIYLVALSCSDFVFLVLHIVIELRYAWGIRTLSYPVVCELYFLVYLAPQYLSPILVLGFTVERYISICHPFRREKFCTTKRATKVVAALAFGSLLLSSVQGYFWTYNPAKKTCDMRPTVAEGGQASIKSIWNLVTELLIFIFVPLFVLFFNILVIKEIHHITKTTRALDPGHHHKGAASTIMLLTVSFYLIITVLPATVVYLLETTISEGNHNMTDDQIRNDPSWQSYIFYITSRKIVEEFALSHYACNIFLYLATGPQFRKAVVDNFKSVWNSRKSSLATYSEVQTRHTNITKV
ncbi:nematocin receptor 2-like [Tubulanus polymorphus]|uniref:nematocin receptor 2-like n=1 Tax=Tubulanus polymorphus TaxID=672921 RepID=UPI003DA54356